LRPVGASVFADLVRTIEPYLGDVVFVGGWVHALYVFEAEGRSARVIRTADIDLTLSTTLEAGERPSLVELLEKGGFDVQAFDEESGLEISKDSIDVDLLAEAPSPRTAVEIAGQSGLRVFGYPHQALLRDNTREMMVGPEIDELLPRARILVPTLPAHVVGKLLSSAERSSRAKSAKDLAYVSDLMSRDSLRTSIIAELPDLLPSYPAETQLARAWLRSAFSSPTLLREVAEQIIEASGFSVADSSSVGSRVKAHLNRLSSEASSEIGFVGPTRCSVSPPPPHLEEVDALPRRLRLRFARQVGDQQRAAHEPCRVTSLTQKICISAFRAGRWPNVRFRVEPNRQARYVRDSGPPSQDLRLRGGCRGHSRANA
jgi:hypothetical protein